ncbi:MAG TPA: hypothetical protein VNB24_06245 [Acidimicrobiales bacterium]|nr:hypothetical protein [Acidimicrobiales bacterium]
MRWVRFLVLSSVAAAAMAVSPTESVAAPSGADAVAGCRAAVGGVPQLGQRACRALESVIWGLGSGCRNLARDVGLVRELREACEAIDGRVVDPDEITAYEASWTHRALGLQRSLDDGVALTRSLLPHTHNSFNAPTYFPTLTSQDPNQIYSLTDQLRMDIRAVEFDVHWVPSVYGDASTGGMALTLCHGNTDHSDDVHVGCTTDRPFTQGLDELAAWMKAPENTDEVVLLYIQNEMNGDAVAHNLATAQIRDHLGDLVARPSAGSPCAPLPTTTSRSALRNAGHRVLIVGNCGPGDWGTWVHERATATHWFESSSGAGDDYPGLVNGCAAERVRTGAGTKITRWYDDSTLVAVMESGNDQGTVSALEAKAMVGCGVNLVGFDQLKPDARLDALVWSWAVDAPAPPSMSPVAAPRCAYLGGDGRFHDNGCATTRRFTCATSPDAWMVTSATGAWADGPAACAAAYPGSGFAVPANGWESAQLKTAAGGAAVWLAYADQSGTGAWSVTP